MTPTMHDVRHQGVDVRLVVRDETMTAIARVGRFAEPVRIHWSHHGLVSPDTPNPQESRLAKALIEEASDRAMQRTRRSEFEKLVDELHEARQRTGRKPLRKAIVFPGKAIVFRRSGAARPIR